MNDRFSESAGRSPWFAAPQNTPDTAPSAYPAAPETPSAAPAGAVQATPGRPAAAPSPAIRTSAPLPGSLPPAYSELHPKPPFTATPIEVGAALVSYLLAWLYIRIFFQSGGHEELLLLVFTFLFWFLTEWFCRLMGRPKASRESRFWVVCMFAIAVSILAWSSRTTAGWDLFLLHIVAAYWAVCRAGALCEGGTGPLLPADLGRAFFTLPFGGFFLRIRTLWHGLRGKKWGRQAGILLATLFFVSPALICAAHLLGGADALFYAQLRDFFEWLELLFSWQYFLCLILSLPVGCYLYGLVAGALRRTPSHGPAAEVRAAAERCRCVPPLAVGAALSAFCALYLFFFVLQARYLFGAFSGRLPEGFTASQYAVQGFWELCQVVLLNFVLLAVAARFSSLPLRRHAGLKCLALLLTGSSALFVVVAASKMALYVGRFGLTANRLLASWFMLVLAVWVVLALVTLCRPFRAVRWGVFAAAGLFALLCLVKPDAIVVRTNLALYEAGVTRELDVGTLRACGAAEDLGSYVRRLQRVGWFEGRSADELRLALGAPDTVEKLPEEAGERLTWELGMNLIDPEWFVATLAPDEGGRLCVQTAQIVQG